MKKIVSIDAYGTSRVDEKDVLSLRVHIDALNGTYSTTKTVSDPTAYAAHKEQCDADVTEIETRVLTACFSDGE